MKTFYFTGTGNSLYVAKVIGGDLYSIPQMVQAGQHEFKDDAIGFVFPCYALGIPRMVKNFVSESVFTADYFFAVMTYGGMAAAGVRIMEDAGRENGIEFDYSDQILMVDNIRVIVQQEFEEKKDASNELRESIQRVAANIRNRKKQLLEVSDKFVEMTRSEYSDLTHSYLDENDSKYELTGDCNQCKTCEKVCPTGNIIVTDKPIFSHKCEACFACIHHCPNYVINREYGDYGPPLAPPISNARYINPNIELKEVIESNNIKK